jgi:hypothetical protein
LRIPSRKGDKAYFATLQEELGHCENVTGSVTNPLTGSVLIYYIGSCEAIKEFAQSRKMFIFAEKKRLQDIMGATLTSYRYLDTRLKKLTRGEVDLPMAAFAALAGAGVYRMAQGKVTAPAWHTAFWYALNIFLKARANRGLE